MAASSRPYLFESIPSSAPLSPNPNTALTDNHSLQKEKTSNRALLTPPASPRVSILSSPSNFPTHNATADLKARSLPEQDGHQLQFLSPELLKCSLDIEITKDEAGQDQILGTGAWSTVYRAVCRGTSQSHSGLTTSALLNVALPALVAVKKPTGWGADVIVKGEGLVLSHLASFDDYTEYIPSFYGYHSPSGSLVLGAVPLSLEDAIRSGASSVTDPSAPFIGSSKSWLLLASRLIHTLAWLHDVTGVVHGDIKPSNILLSPNGNGNHEDAISQYDPLLVDFSSSHILNSASIGPNNLSAVTREYTAPELLQSAVFRNPNSVTTRASDVFSLAVTLLVAATGQLTVYPPSYSIWQRQALAVQGYNVLDNVRNSGDRCAARVPKLGLVDQLLNKAVLKADLGRFSASRWAELVDLRMKGEPSNS